MAIVHVNDQSVDIGNDRLNLVEAADRAGVFIPHYCWHPALSVVASCRMCLVEVGEKKPDGSVAMQPRVVPACQTPAKDGTVVITNSPKAKYAQEQTLESLLLNHPLDCPVCDKAGECHLQDYSFQYGRSESRMIDQKNTPPNKDYIGEHITLFTDRCIMCSRCVRFTREVSGRAELHVIHRGTHAEIDIFPGEPLDNKLSGNVVDLCPVGALCSKDFLYKQRVWYLKSHQSVCAGCSTGCSINVDSNKDIVYRLRPRFNPQAQGHFMCDEGRFGFHYVNARERLTRPQVKSADGNKPNPWDTLLPGLRDELKAAAKTGLTVLVSPFLSCEEAYLLCKWAKGLSEESRLVLGPVPIVGEDDTYPKDRRGNAVEPIKFTIRKEKCPNRLGVEAVLRHFQGEVLAFDQCLNELKAVYVTAGYPPIGVEPFTDAQVDALSRASLLIVQDILPSKLGQHAKYLLPGAAFAEKEGVYVNHSGLAQLAQWATMPPQEARPDGKIFMDLMGRPGLYLASTIRSELADEVSYFAPLKKGLGEHGIKL